MNDTERKLVQIEKAREQQRWSMLTLAVLEDVLAQIAPLTREDVATLGSDGRAAEGSARCYSYVRLKSGAVRRLARPVEKEWVRARRLFGE